MAFPTVSSFTSGVTSANSTSVSVNLPASVSAGDLLMVRIGFSSTGTVTWDNTTAGSWTKLVDVANGTSHTYQIYIKVADGTEDSKTLAITIPSGQIAYRSVAFAGVDTSVTPEFNTTTGSSSAPNSLSLTPSWGALDTLWLSDEANANGSTSVSAYPAGWAGGTNHMTATLAGVGIGCSNLSSNVATVDPGAYTLSTSKAWIAVTVAVKPTTGGGSTSSTLSSSQAQTSASSLASSVSSTESSTQAQTEVSNLTRTVTGTVTSSQSQSVLSTLTTTSSVTSSVSSAQGQTDSSNLTRAISSAEASAQTQSTNSSTLTSVGSTLSSLQAQTDLSNLTRTITSAVTSSQAQTTAGVASRSSSSTVSSSIGQTEVSNLTRTVSSLESSTQAQTLTVATSRAAGSALTSTQGQTSSAESTPSITSTVSTANAQTDSSNLSTTPVVTASVSSGQGSQIAGSVGWDSFTSTDGTLESYSPLWTRHPAYSTGALYTRSGMVRGNATYSCLYLYGIPPPSPDYSVEGDLVFLENNGGQSNPSLLLRWDATNNTGYMARYSGVNGIQWQIYKFVNGAATLLSSFNASISIGSVVHFKFEIIGYNLALYINNSTTPLITATDSAITSTGRTGVRFYVATGVTDTNGTQLDRFLLSLPLAREIYPTVESSASQTTEVAITRDLSSVQLSTQAQSGAISTLRSSDSNITSTQGQAVSVGTSRLNSSSIISRQGQQVSAETSRLRGFSLSSAQGQIISSVIVRSVGSVLGSKQGQLVNIATSRSNSLSILSSQEQLGIVSTTLGIDSTSSTSNSQGINSLLQNIILSTAVSANTQTNTGDFTLQLEALFTSSSAQGQVTDIVSALEVIGVITSYQSQEIHTLLTKAIRGLVLKNGIIVPVPIGEEGVYASVSIGIDGRLYAGITGAQGIVFDKVLNKIRTPLITETVVV